MDLDTMQRLGLIVGSPVRITTTRKYVYCTAWPREDVDGFKIVQFDDLISSTSSAQNTISTSPQYISIPEDILKLQPEECLCLTVSVYLKDIENSRNRLSKTLYENQLTRRLSVFLKGLTVAKGCVVKPRHSRNNSNQLSSISNIVIDDIQPNIADCTSYTISNNTKIKLNSIKIAHSIDNDAQFAMAGLDDTVQMLREMLRYPFEYPESFAYMGLECPKGILLQGAPGVGKTLLVKNVTAECDAQLITMNGTDIFGPHSGESEENLRKTFEQAW